MSITKLVTNVTLAVKLATGNTKLTASLAPEADTSGLKKLLPSIDFASHATVPPCFMALQVTVLSVVVTV